MEWKPYGERRDTGVRAYALLPDAIALRFQDGSTYLYDGDSPGRLHVRHMQGLALEGAGLTTYVNRHVRERFSQKLQAARRTT